MTTAPSTGVLIDLPLVDLVHDLVYNPAEVYNMVVYNIHEAKTHFASTASGREPSADRHQRRYAETLGQGSCAHQMAVSDSRASRDSENTPRRDRRSVHQTVHTRRTTDVHAANVGASSVSSTSATSAH